MGWVGKLGGVQEQKKKKKKCGRLQKIVVVLCKGDDSVRLKFCVNGGGSAGFC